MKAINKNHVFKLLSVIAMSTSFLIGAKALQGDWKRIAPEGESFRIQMPTNASEGTRLIAFADKSWVPARVFFSLANARRFSVFSVRKTTPQQFSSLTSFKDFFEAIERSFANTEGPTFEFESAGTLDQHNWRQYQLRIGGVEGVARLIETDRVFYALIVTGASDKDPDVQRFLTSFESGDTNDESSGVDISDYSQTESQSATDAQSSVVPDLWPRIARPIRGGVLNGKAISLPKPEYPVEARRAGISGAVSVQIVIDESGRVIFAEPVDGPNELRRPSLEAAQESRFAPTRLMGQPVKVSGRIVYNFVSFKP